MNRTFLLLSVLIMTMIASAQNSNIPGYVGLKNGNDVNIHKVSRKMTYQCYDRGDWRDLEIMCSGYQIDRMNEKFAGPEVSIIKYHPPFPNKLSEPLWLNIWFVNADHAAEKLYTPEHGLSYRAQYYPYLKLRETTQPLRFGGLGLVLRPGSNRIKYAMRTSPELSGVFEIAEDVEGEFTINATETNQQLVCDPVVADRSIRLSEDYKWNAGLSCYRKAQYLCSLYLEASPTCHL